MSRKDPSLLATLGHVPDTPSDSTHSPPLWPYSMGIWNCTVSSGCAVPGRTSRMKKLVRNTRSWGPPSWYRGYLHRTDWGLSKTHGNRLPMAVRTWGLLTRGQLGMASAVSPSPCFPAGQCELSGRGRARRAPRTVPLCPEAGSTTCLGQSGQSTPRGVEERTVNPSITQWTQGPPRRPSCAHGTPGTMA